MPNPYSNIFTLNEFLDIIKPKLFLEIEEFMQDQYFKDGIIVGICKRCREKEMATGNIIEIIREFVKDEEDEYLKKHYISLAYETCKDTIKELK